MEKEELLKLFSEEEAAAYEQLVKREKELNDKFRNAKMHYNMMDLHHSRMKMHNGILIALWLGSWICWKLVFWDLGKFPGLGHRWGRMGGTLFVLGCVIPLTIKGVRALKDLLQNCRIPYFVNRAKENGYESLAVEKEKSEDIMFQLSDELGKVQFQLQKMNDRKNDNDFLDGMK